jgi:hypothetical protein
VAEWGDLAAGEMKMAKKKPAKKLTKSKKLEAAKPLFSGPSGTGKTMG